MIPPHLPSWCEVSRAALAANVAVFRRRLADGAQLGMVVKSDAYGHGLVECSRVFVENGVDWLIVNTVTEAEILRRAGLTAPIYICGPVPAARARDVVAAAADVVVHDAEPVRALDAAASAMGRSARIHIKVETGTHRQGLPAREALALGRLAKSLANTTLVGLTTHYADIEDTTDHGFALAQLERFRDARKAFADAGIDVPMVHSANSAATILWPETHGTLVRVGISAYGLWPSTETYATVLQNHVTTGAGFLPELVPALAWRARIAQVKHVPEGGFVGYGRTFRATHPMRLAVLPLGYYEGYDRRLSNMGHVLVGGVRAPVRGRVCMNMTMVDVTHIPAADVGAVATLLGSDGDERVSAEQLAGWMGTINYEVVSRIHPEQPRHMV